MGDQFRNLDKLVCHHARNRTTKHHGNKYDEEAIK